MTSKGSLEFPLKPLPGSSDDPESAATAITIPDSDNARSKSTTVRTLLAVFLIVGVVAAVGICTVVFAPGKRSSESEDRIDHEAHVPSSVDEQNIEMNERRVSILHNVTIISIDIYHAYNPFNDYNPA